MAKNDADRTSDVSSMTIGHEIDAIISEVTKERIIDKFAIFAYATQLGLELDRESLHDIFSTLVNNIRLAAMNQSTWQQSKEYNPLLINLGDGVATFEWMSRNLDRPEIRNIIRRETKKTYKYLDQLSLQQSQNSVKDNAMSPEVRNIIEQARAETQPPQTTEHPAPQTPVQLNAIIKEATYINEIVTDLHEENIPFSRTEALITISGLHSIAIRGSLSAWAVGLHAVERGLITQMELADMLDVSQKTVSRRYRATSDMPEESA